MRSSPVDPGGVGGWVAKTDDGSAIVLPVRQPSALSQLCARFVVEGEAYEPHFSGFVIACIIVAGVLVGLQTYPVLEEDPTIAAVDLGILGVFILEVLLKVLALDRRPQMYFIGDDKEWNIFDFTIVVLSVVDTFGGGLPMPVSFLRLLRLARILKLVKKVPDLQVIVMGLAGGLSSIMYIMMLLGLLFYLYAIMGIMAFRQNDYWHFKNIGVAFMTLFRAATLEDWTDIMYINIFGCDDYTGGIYDNSSPFRMYHCERAVKNPIISPLYWTTFIIIAAMIMMSLFVGAITMAMTESMDRMKEEKAAEDEEKMAAFVEKNRGRKEGAAAEAAPKKVRDVRQLGMAYDEIRVVQSKRRMRDLLNLHWAGSRAKACTAFGDEDMLELFYPPGLLGSFFRFRERCLAFVSHDVISNFVTCIILLAGMVVGVQTDVAIMRSGFGLKVLPIVDLIILVIFIVEVVLKLFGLGPWEFFENRWNTFDFWVVLGGVVNLLPVPGMDSMGGLITMLRLLRLLRVLRVVKRVPQLTIIVDALTTGLGSIGFIGVILFLVFYIFAIVGIILFRENDPFHFGNLQMAMLSLFRVATLEDWSDIMYINIFGCGRYGYDDEMTGKLYFAPSFQCDTEKVVTPVMAGFAAVYFVVFVVIGALVLLTLFVGVVCTAMEDATNKQEDEKKVKQRLEEYVILQELPEDAVKAYREIFDILDKDGSGKMEVAEFSGPLMELYDHLSEEDIGTWIKELDKTSDNMIDLCEFVMFLSKAGTAEDENAPPVVDEAARNSQEFMGKDAGQPQYAADADAGVLDADDIDEEQA